MGMLLKLEVSTAKLTCEIETIVDSPMWFLTARYSRTAPSSMGEVVDLVPGVLLPSSEPSTRNLLICLFTMLVEYNLSIRSVVLIYFSGSSPLISAQR